jgi:hypothetical protein
VDNCGKTKGDPPKIKPGTVPHLSIGSNKPKTINPTSMLIKARNCRHLVYIFSFHTEEVSVQCAPAALQVDIPALHPDCP